MNMKAFIQWYGQTAKLVGYPILFIILMTAVERMMFTVTCSLGGYQCEYSLMAQKGVQDYVGDLATSKGRE